MSLLSQKSTNDMVFLCQHIAALLCTSMPRSRIILFAIFMFCLFQHGRKRIIGKELKFFWWTRERLLVIYSQQKMYKLHIVLPSELLVVTKFPYNKYANMEYMRVQCYNLD
ncbi:hypothetical protein BDC45DRAFT_538245 [Circinella umbellata]|nr:hypothetical protein BDC45DRAFT_538245 [Circinella umbellata]